MDLEERIREALSRAGASAPVGSAPPTTTRKSPKRLPVAVAAMAIGLAAVAVAWLALPRGSVTDRIQGADAGDSVMVPLDGRVRGVSATDEGAWVAVQNDSPCGGSVVFVTNEGSVSDAIPVAGIPVDVAPLGPNVWALELSCDGGVGSVRAYDDASHEVRTSLDLQPQSAPVAMASDGHSMFVDIEQVDGNAEVIRIDPSFAVGATNDFEARPRDVVATSTAIWVLDTSLTRPQIVTLDKESLDQLGAWSLDGTPSGLAADSQGAWVGGQGGLVKFVIGEGETIHVAVSGDARPVAVLGAIVISVLHDAETGVDSIVQVDTNTGGTTVLYDSDQATVDDASVSPDAQRVWITGPQGVRIVGLSQL